MDEEENKPAFYAVIPANVRYDSSLKPNAKLLYGEITALCSSKGYCWAGNEYFAELYGVNLKTISSWISQLVAKNLLEREIFYKNGTKEVDSRVLRIPVPYPLPIKKWVPSPQNHGEGEMPLKTDVAKQKGEKPLSMKKWRPLHEKTEENNTCEYNNINNTCIGEKNLNADSAFKFLETQKENKKFIPPSVEEVAAYCEERKNNVNAQRFCDFYSSKGWYVGKNKMKNWKAAVRTWEQPDKSFKSPKNSSLEELQKKGMDIL